MYVDTPLPLLGGLTPAQFMKRHWQKKPLVIRQAIAGMRPLLDRAELFDLAALDEVESRLVVQAQPQIGKAWRMRHGPFARKALPPLKQPGWTLLVQGVDLHDARVRALRDQFRFVPDARLDDVMISYASDGGGVGPHFDSYDVFLLQVHGTRKWRFGRQKDLRLQPHMPLKILAHFEPELEFVLEPGDMLYLPPRYAHDGIAQGECMTYSIGFRSPSADELAQEILQRLAEDTQGDAASVLYRDPDQTAQFQSAKIPAALAAFAKTALKQSLRDPFAVQRALGSYLSEPKATVMFDASEPMAGALQSVALDRCTRMLFDARHIFINGEAFMASGEDAKWMRILANTHALSAVQVGRLSPGALGLLQDWVDAGWVQSLG